MSDLLFIATGGALGAIFRFLVVGWVTDLLGRSFPYGTLTVNIVGSFFIGIMYIVIVQKLNTAPEVKAIILVGFLGAFTTFSTFSLETFSMLEQGQFMHVLLYVGGSILMGLVAVWAGASIGKML